MTDTISVLLIIGAATLGPIDGGARCTASCAHDHLPKEWCTCEPILTFAQTCERAMKEIGAYHPSQSVPGTSNDVAAMSNGWLVGARPVLCIPTPTGYRR